jgi:hypothetical protein
MIPLGPCCDRAPPRNISFYRRIRIARACLLSFALTISCHALFAADHNDPNGVNSIFSDIPISSADLYGMFGYPSDDTTDGEKVIVELTFASLPATGVFDSDLLYTIHLDADPGLNMDVEPSLEGLLHYASALKDKYFQQEAPEIRVTFNSDNQAKVDFLGFPGGSFSKVLNTNQVLTIDAPDGGKIKAFIGGRDDPFFNDLPGFFRSINYGPQYYKVAHTAPSDERELPIPKTLIELEDNPLFNYDPAHPDHGRPVNGHTEKLDLHPGPYTWGGKAFKKDENGNFRLVYSGRDAQSGINVNAIVFEIPLSFLTEKPEEDRVVRIWGESWVLKAANKVETIPDEVDASWLASIWKTIKGWLSSEPEPPEMEGFNSDKGDYKLVDVVGVPFLDAALNERLDERQGHNNLLLARQYVMRFGHLGWGFGPSISALGLGTCFDHDNSSVSVHKTYDVALAAFPRVKKCFFQTLHMPDESWNKSGKPIREKRTFEIFLPNVTSVDMDTTGTWPFGRRPEDQVASRFLTTFLDMETGCGGGPCNIETLNDAHLWDGAPVEPKNPLNPYRNDKPFLAEFPYLAEPW